MMYFISTFKRQPTTTMQRRHSIHLLLIFLFVSFSCAVNKFRQPITNFQTATAVVVAHARSVIIDLNRVQRNRMIARHREENKPIQLRDLKDSRLIQNDDLNVRLQALDNLSDYVDLLVQIANSDAPDRIARSAVGLSDAMNTLTTTVSGLTTPTNNAFKTVFTTASPAIAEILRSIAQKKIKEAVETAVLKGEKPINDLIAAIGDDLEVAFFQRRANMEEDREALLHQYNTEVTKNPRSERALEELSKQVMAHEDLMDELANASPKSTLNAMAKAHSKLVAYAHDKSPGSFAEAAEAIEIFVAIGKKFGEAALKLKAQNT